MVDDDHEIKGFILIADDDISYAEAFGKMLELREYKTIITDSAENITKLIDQNDFDLVTLDLDWGDEGVSGIGILKNIKAKDPSLPVIMITGQASITTAVEATRLGAFDYIQKTTDREKTFIAINNAIENGRLKRLKLKDSIKRYELIGKSPAMIRVKREIERVGPADKTVMLIGESGSGKEMVARQIHYHSPRRDKQFVQVDCGNLAGTLAESLLFGHKKGAFTGALSDKVGYFEEANGGTLFLDEIQNASSEIQMKLLRAIDTGEYRRVGDDRDRRCDVRLIIASNEDLKQKVKEGKFREDLYYRISVIEIKIPPLRERKEDIPLLASRFLAREAKELKSPVECISPDALLALIDYSWPGNVRQLKNSIINLLCRCDNNEIGPTEVLALLLSDNQYVPLKSLEEMVRGFKKECAIKALTLTNRNVTKAAELLKIDRATLYRLIEECGLKEFIKSQ